MSPETVATLWGYIFAAIVVFLWYFPVIFIGFVSVKGYWLAFSAVNRYQKQGKFLAANVLLSLLVISLTLGSIIALALASKH